MSVPRWVVCAWCLIRGHVVAECLACKGTGYVRAREQRP